MRVDKNGGAWCPRNMIGRDASEWIEIDLRALHVITAAETMGRFGNGQGAEYAEAYVIEYYRCEESNICYLLVHFTYSYIVLTRTLYLLVHCTRTLYLLVHCTYSYIVLTRT
jgi:hypothetical protein